MSILGAQLQGQSGQSIAQNWSQSSSGSQSSNYGYSNSTQASQSWESGYSSSWDNIYGKEASAADILRAAEANEAQREMWEMQAYYNSLEAEKSRIWQEKMSNTAYQRAVNDLIKAGLNPILAVGSIGASTPVGAVASSGLSSAYKAQTYADKRAGSYSSWSGGSSSSGSSKSENWGSGSSGSQSSSYGYEQSKTTNNAKSIADSIMNGVTNIVGSNTYLGDKLVDTYNRLQSQAAGRKKK